MCKSNSNNSNKWTTIKIKSYSKSDDENLWIWRDDGGTSCNGCFIYTFITSNDRNTRILV